MTTSDRTDTAWPGQIGPALSEEDAARLLGASTSAVRADRQLLRISNSDGRPVYPVVQFDDQGQVPGVADVVVLLTGSLQPLTIASWLTAPNPALAKRTPLQAMQAGERDAVCVLASRLAAATSH